MLRVIGGKAKGRLLKVPAGSKIRPTSEKVRESLFNIISPAGIAGARFIDLFAGSGAVGIEALSRGASHVTFIESNPKHIRIIWENISRCGFQQYAAVFLGDAVATLSKIKQQKATYDIIFADPPYNYSKWKILLPKIISSVSISDYGFLIVEHATRDDISIDVNGFLELYGKYVYGDTTLTVSRKKKTF